MHPRHHQNVQIHGTTFVEQISERLSYPACEPHGSGCRSADMTVYVEVLFTKSYKVLFTKMSTPR